MLINKMFGHPDQLLLGLCWTVLFVHIGPEVRASVVYRSARHRTEEFTRTSSTCCNMVLHIHEVQKSYAEMVDISVNSTGVSAFS